MHTVCRQCRCMMISPVMHLLQSHQKTFDDESNDDDDAEVDAEDNADDFADDDELKSEILSGLSALNTLNEIG